MGKIMKAIRKYRWVLYGFCIVIILVGIGLFVLRKVGLNLQARAFQDYILLDYMPSQKKKQKKWPTTLDGIEQVAKSSVLYPSIVGYYRNNFIKIEPVQECGDSYVYRIFTKDLNSTCKVTINPDGGYCWSGSG